MSATTHRRKRPARVEDWCTYHFRIECLRAHYSFAPSLEFETTAYTEHLQPEIDAVCLAPERFKDRLTSLTIIGSRSLERGLWLQEPASSKPIGIGMLTMRGGQSTYLGSMPYDAVWRIQSHILAGGFRFIHLHGAVMHRGTARIQWMAFDQEFDLDDA